MSKKKSNLSSVTAAGAAAVCNCMKIQHLIPFLVFLLVALGCQPSQRVLEDRQPTATPFVEETPEVPRDDFDERLKSVQTGDFYYIYAFRRKDGEPFTSDDTKYFKENIPPDTNQIQRTADKKVIIVGTNYLFDLQSLDALKKRFKIEDYSPKKEPKQEQNSNVNR